MFWVDPPRRVEAADVAVSIARLSQIALPAALALLDEAELARAQSITFGDYRLQVVKARAMLRVMLARYTGVSPLSFQFDEQGGTRPRLRSNPWGPHFSVSHSEDQVAVAIATAPIGIDIERVGADCDWQAVADVCFHPVETKGLRGFDDRAGRQAFFDIWTRKEAYLKAIGTGLGTDPASFFIAGRDGTVATDDGNPPAGTWYTRAIDAPAGYKAALATPWPHPRLIDWTLDGALAAQASPCPIGARGRRRFAAANPVFAEGWAG